jgi:UDP-4-amino-4,6-dideoxy-N-acetyl-beta-L-altrosamine transaminase
MIPYGRQEVTQSDIDAVVAVLTSDFLTQGPAVPSFERAVAARVRAKYGVAVNSATAALHVACMALELSPGMRLWTVPNTFVASANCGRYCGADVDFVDIDPATWNLSVPALRKKLVGAKESARLPNVVVPVHLCGQPTEQEAIWELAQQYGFKILEDASHAIGASRRDEPVGSCRWSHITVFSFHPVKIITTGEGGMAMTNDGALAHRMRMLRSHGITREPALFQCAEALSEPSAAPWYYEQQMLGLNYRMTDIQAALGISQLARIDGYIERRNALAQRYDRALRDLPLQLPNVHVDNRSAYHLYVVRLKAAAILRKSHRRVFNELRQRNIGVNLHYIPVHLQPYYRELGFAPGQYPEAEAYGESAITLPLYPALTDRQQDSVIAALKEII